MADFLVAGVGRGHPLFLDRRVFIVLHERRDSPGRAPDVVGQPDREDRRSHIPVAGGFGERGVAEEIVGMPAPVCPIAKNRAGDRFAEPHPARHVGMQERQRHADQRHAHPCPRVIQPFQVARHGRHHSVAPETFRNAAKPQRLAAEGLPDTDQFVSRRNGIERRGRGRQID
jgi:hypothetical protein